MRIFSFEFILWLHLLKVELENTREITLHSSLIKSEVKSVRDLKQKYFFIVNDDKRQE